MKWLRGWLTRLACRWFGLVPNGHEQRALAEPLPPSGWDDLWDAKDVRIVWPRMVRSVAWKEMEVFFKQSLLETLIKLTRERDPDTVRRLQERAQLISDWLERPRLALAVDEAAFNNAWRSGKAERFRAEQERANAR